MLSEDRACALWQATSIYISFNFMKNRLEQSVDKLSRNTFIRMTFYTTDDLKVRRVKFKRARIWALKGCAFRHSRHSGAVVE